MTARLIPQSEGVAIISLEKAITLIGRHPDCDGILPDNQKISRRHCCIAQVENRLILRDLGSMNGVVVNGAQVSEIDLNDGDEITIGDEDFVLEIKAKGAASKNPAKPVKKVLGDAPTPEKPKPTPRVNNSATSASASHRRPIPVDISQEFPVPIPEPEDEESSEESGVRRPANPRVSRRPTIPPIPSMSAKTVRENLDDQIEEDLDDDMDRDFHDDILKLDSGEIQLRDIDDFDPSDFDPEKKKKS